MKVAVELGLDEAGRDAFSRLVSASRSVAEKLEGVDVHGVVVGLRSLSDAMVQKADPVETDGIVGRVIRDLEMVVDQVRHEDARSVLLEPLVGLRSLVEVVNQTEKRDEPTHRLTVIKQEDQDERTALGIVLEPETVDSQGDIYSEDEIRKTAWRFLEEYQNFGLMHKEVRRDIFPLESFIAPVDMNIAGQEVKKGTWLLRVRILDDSIWAAVKSGRYTGFSIGGSAIRKPDRSEQS